MSEIPDNWEILPLKAIANSFIVPMRDKPKKFSGDIPWIRIEDFEGKFLKRSKTSKCVDKSTVEKMKLKVYPKGTVLCSCSATLGVCAIVEEPLISNQTLFRICSESTLEASFVFK